MCLGVPMRIGSIDGEHAQAELGGVVREVSLMLVPGCEVGDYVLVHAGFAISRIDEEEAEETVALLREKYSSGSPGPEDPAT